MSIAIFRFHDYSDPEYRLLIYGSVDPVSMRKMLARATHGYSREVKYEIGRYLPRVINALFRHATVLIERTGLFDAKADFLYSLESDEKGAPLLRIINRNNNTLLYAGGYFRFLLHGTEPLPPRKPSRRLRKGEDRGSRARARKLAADAAYAAQHGQRKNKFYTREQLRLQNEHRAILQESRHKSESAKRRHKRKHETPKLTLDEIDAIRAKETAQMRAPMPLPAKKPRMLSVDFTSDDHDDEGSLTDNN